MARNSKRLTVERGNNPSVALALVVPAPFPRSGVSPVYGIGSDGRYLPSLSKEAIMIFAIAIVLFTAPFIVISYLEMRRR